MALDWKQVKTNKWLKDCEVYRAMVPGGWLVATTARPGWNGRVNILFAGRINISVAQGSSGLTFYPDPEHTWKP